MAKARSARTLNQREKTRSVTHSTDRDNEVSKIFIISLRLNFLIYGPYSEIRPAKLTNHTARAN